MASFIILNKTRKKTVNMSWINNLQKYNKIKILKII